MTEPAPIRCHDDLADYIKQRKEELGLSNEFVEEKCLMTKGHVDNVKNQVGGYSIVQANSHDEAAKIFADSAHLMMPGAWVEVMELMEM